MKLFEKKKGKPGLIKKLNVQLREGEKHPFDAIAEYRPGLGSEVGLYRAIREAVPIVDAAVLKIIRLAGGLSIKCHDSAVQSAVNEFLRFVPVGRGQCGLQSFLDGYLDSLLTCGAAVGEIVLGQDMRVAAVLCGDIRKIDVWEGESPLDFHVGVKSPWGDPKPVECEELIMFTPYNPEPDRPYGVSLLHSMPFLTGVLLKIFQATGSNWERVGNVRYAVRYKPNGDEFDRANATEQAQRMAQQWSEAMQQTKAGRVHDFVAVGDVEIKAIGADNQILDSEVPVRQILEQLIARTGIPPFLLGLNWSTTERMSAQQSDLMTSELTALRRVVTPVVEKIVSVWMRAEGCACPFEVEWDAINLQDQVEEARAKLLTAQAESLGAG